ncbi:DUF4404 family protein [Agarilytica rhodophyticola]|uniref:DUF4404 family protein n=1 Tax=Agarilytica rhodophyticola TaxID=1737490 RepID=UPI000B349F1F|nr:DUF4404 family protein [Agarilytica rhodophyticola]
MGDTSIKQSLEKLQHLLNSSGVDGETLALAQKLEADIQQTLDESNGEESINSSVDLALALESRFELEHPVAAGCVRELINALHKMGI